MSQQPKAPDLFDSDEDDPAGDPPTGTYIAPDQPMGATAHGITAREGREGETFDERSRHLDPEEEHFDSTAVGQILQSGDDDVDSIDDDAGMFAWSEGDEGDLSAEESAMHTTDNP